MNDGMRPGPFQAMVDDILWRWPDASVDIRRSDYRNEYVVLVRISEADVVLSSAERPRPGQIDRDRERLLQLQDQQ